MAAGLALLLCLFTAYVMLQEGERKGPQAGRQPGAALVFDLDAEEGEEKHRLLPLLPPLPFFCFGRPQVFPQWQSATPPAGVTNMRLYLLFRQLKLNPA